jgi:hypothetical protein
MITTLTASLRAHKQSIVTLWRDGLLGRFAPRNDDLKLQLLSRHVMRRQRDLRHRRTCARATRLSRHNAGARGTRYGGGVETLTVAVKVDRAGGRQGQWQSQ